MWEKRLVDTPDLAEYVSQNSETPIRVLRFHMGVSCYRIQFVYVVACERFRSIQVTDSCTSHKYKLHYFPSRGSLAHANAVTDPCDP